MSLDPVENHCSQEIGTEDNERIMLIGSDDDGAANVNGRLADESKKMKEDAEEGELEDGELDDETEELGGQSDQAVREPSPDETPVVQEPESELPPVKSEKRRERSDSERKSKGHSHHRSVPRTAALFDGTADVSKDDEGKETPGRPQRHGKRRDKQRGKEESDKKKTNYSTYVDFDDIQEDFETDDSWMHGSRSKRSRRSRDSLRGPYDSPSGSGDEDFDADEEAQSSSRNYRSQYQYNYGGFYETLPEEDEDDDDNEQIDQNSDYTDSKGHYMKQPSQDGGYKGSPGGYHRSSSSERKTRHLMPRKRKLVDTPMEERPACKFFREGKCVKGSDCPFNHDFVPPKKEDVCRFYLNERGCTRENCVFYHADWPCRYYHKTGSCTYGDSCKFSHAELTDETRHLIYLDSSDDHHSENWRSSSGNDSFQASEKKKIPSLLDLEIYPPGQEPRIPSPNFSPRPVRAPYKRQRSSGQPGLLGAGPQMSGGSRMSSRMRQMGCHSKGYYSSYGGDQFGIDDSSPPQPMYSPDNSVQGEGGDEEPYQSRSGDEEDMEPMTSMTGGIDLATGGGGGQSVDVSNLPPVQRDLYRRIQQNQQFPQNTLSQTSNNNAQMKEKWYSSDEEGDGCDTRSSEAMCSTSVTPSDIIQSLAGQASQMQKPLKPDSVQSMPPMFGMPPPCGLMPRGMPPPREMMHPPDMMSQGPRPMQGMPPRPEMMLSQRNMTPLQEMMSKGMGMMLPQTMAPPPDMMPPRCMMQHSDMMGQGMMLPRNMMGQGMMPPRGMMPPSDMMGQGMMPPRGMMPPSDMMGQGMMPPRGVPPPSDMMSLGMMQQRGMAPPSDMMPQGMMPPQGVKGPSDMPLCSMVPPGMPQPDGGMPSPFNLQGQGMGPFDINHILSVIRNSALQLPPNLLLPSTATTDIMANASSNFNQSHDPRTSGNMVDPRTSGNMIDPRLQVSEPPPSDVGMMPVSSFLQPPESPDQEIEKNAAGKKIPYVLHPITIDAQPGPPSSVNLESLHNSSDPRLQKYLNHNQTNTKTRSGNEMESSESVVPAKPTDPRLSKRGGSETRNPSDAESGNDGNKGTKQQKPYTLPDIVLPVLSNPVQDKASTAKVTDSTVGTRKAVLDDPAPRATSIPPPSIKPVDKTLQNLVELPEALQERNFPLDGRLSRQSSTGSVGRVSTNADKKVIDYRNDPRYKKKKTKPLLEEYSVVQPQKLGKVKGSIGPAAASTKEEWTSEQNTVTESTASDSSMSHSPISGNFKAQQEEFSEEVQEAEVEESDSFNPKLQKSEKTSVHMPVTFFEGVPSSNSLSDVEPTQEINLKDMFKTIDPTTSPFC